MDRERCVATARRIGEVSIRYQGKGLNEQNTRNALIEPVLASLGWPKEDLERVQAEYRHTARTNPVDYALLVQGRPVVLVEAKALDAPVEEPRFVAQVLSYANMAGAEWAIVTNGYRWDLYAVLARGEIQNKKIFSVALGDPDFCDWMAWITPERVEGSELERFWRLLVAERTVKATVTRLFQERADTLVQLLAKETGLDGTEVATAIQTLRISFEGPSMEGRLQILARQAEGPRRALPTPLPSGPMSVPAPPPAAEVATSSTRSSPTPLPNPPSGRKPASYSIGDQTWKTSSWRDLITRTADFIWNTHRDRYETLFTNPELQGRKRPYFTKDSSMLVSALAIPRGFTEGNQSASSIVRLVNAMLEQVGVAIPVVYTLRDEPAPPEGDH